MPGACGARQRETGDPRTYTGNKYRFARWDVAYQRNLTVTVDHGGVGACATRDRAAFPRGVWLHPLSARISKRTRASGESRPGPAGRG